MVYANKIDLPEVAATVDLADILPEKYRDLVLDESKMVLALQERPAVLPKAKTMVAGDKEHVRLVRRLHTKNTVRFIRMPVVVNGYFAVTKDPGADRFIASLKPGTGTGSDPGSDPGPGPGPGPDSDSCSAMPKTLTLECFDYDLVSGSDLMGAATCDLETLTDRKAHRAWYRLTPKEASGSRTSSRASSISRASSASRPGSTKPGSRPSSQMRCGCGCGCGRG